jgi:serine/threonine-protein kinase
MTKAASMPEKIGRYQILERVGKGGMGVLFRGYDPVLDREVAVKVMLADFSDDTEQMRPRFYREAKSAAKLQHRNIVTIFEFAEENNQPHIVMEFLRGLPLSSRMEQKPALTLDDKLDIVAQLCSGLGYAHSQGVVHRDVKPANVFLLEDGTVKLLDFGIAKLATSTLTRQGDVVGSAPYMSPEQIAGAQDLDGRSDVWSTGVLLYELLSGRKPFEGDGLTQVLSGILREAPPAIDQLVPGIPPALVAVLNKALEKDRDKRYQSAEELGRELQLIRKTHQLSAPAPMDETRYASTNVLKALHDDRQKQDGAPANKTLQQPPPAAMAATSAGSKTTMIAAAAVIALMGVAGGGYYAVQQSRATNANPTQPVNSPISTPAQPGQQPPATQPAGNAPSNAATTTSAPQPETKTAAVTPDKTTPPPVKKSTPRQDAATPSGPASAPSAPAPAPAPARATVAVTINGSYEFEVMDGSRVVSAFAKSHELPPQVNGKTLKLVAPDVFLDHAFKVDGGDDHKFEYTAPGLGMIEIRAARTNCKAMIGKRDLGVGPWTPISAAAGDYKIELICPDGQNPFETTTVTQGRRAQVRFTAK